MTRRSLAAASVLLALVSCNAPEGDPRAAEKEIREQVGRYTAALDAADTNLASQVWDTAPDVETEGRESQVYRKTTAGWRMAHGHYSGPAMAFQ